MSDARNCCWHGRSQSHAACQEAKFHPVLANRFLISRKRDSFFQSGIHATTGCLFEQIPMDHIVVIKVTRKTSIMRHSSELQRTIFLRFASGISVIASSIFKREPLLSTSPVIQKNLAKILLISFGVLATAHASSNSEEKSRASMQKAPAAVAARGPLPRLPDDVTDLKFREFFKMPIGPRGLEPSAKLISLNGKRVRILGYMARQETPTPGFFILAPLPVALGDEDESLSDDLPASSIFVHIDQTAATAPVATGLPPTIPYYADLLRLTGVLSLGSFDEADGHVSTVRLQLDPALAHAITGTPEVRAASLQASQQASK